MVNGRTYGWEDIRAKLPGFDLEIQSIEYSDEMEKEASYGTGSKPRGYGTGNYKADCKIAMLKDDYDDFVKWCKSQGASLYKLEIPKIVVSYAMEGERIKNDVINKLTPTKVSNKAAQGDKNLTVEIELLVYGTVVRDGLASV